MFSTINHWIRAGLELSINPFWSTPSCVLFSFYLILYHPPLCWVVLSVLFRVWANVLILCISRMLNALWDVPVLLRTLMISDGTPFTRTNCFVVGNVVPVSPRPLFYSRLPSDLIPVQFTS